MFPSNCGARAATLLLQGTPRSHLAAPEKFREGRRSVDRQSRIADEARPPVEDGSVGCLHISKSLSAGRGLSASADHQHLA